MIEDILSKFKENSNKEDAVYMRKYMKNNFEFLGIKSSTRREIQKEFLKIKIEEKKLDYKFVFSLWDCEFREFQYFAIDYIIKMKKYYIKQDIHDIQQLILKKSWWDTVDIISCNIVGVLCSMYNELIDDIIDMWINHQNMWLRRTSILFQLKYKENTNTEFLKKAIVCNSLDKEFFIRKSIGWALREYSKVDGFFVKDFLNSNRVSKLSEREALKYLKKKGDLL